MSLLSALLSCRISCSCLFCFHQQHPPHAHTRTCAYKCTPRTTVPLRYCSSSRTSAEQPAKLTITNFKAADRLNVKVTRSNMKVLLRICRKHLAQILRATISARNCFCTDGFYGSFLHQTIRAVTRPTDK